MNKKKSIVAIIGLAAVLTIGGTFAFFQSITQDKVNTFTMGDNVEAEIVEKEWDTTGKDLANSFYPGLVIPKDPVVKVESGSTKVYVAVKLDYVVEGKSVDFATLSKMLTVNFNTADWIIDADNKIAIYKNELSGTTSTSVVFDKITISKDAVHPDSSEAALPDAVVLKDFDIKVTGFVCQSNVDGLTGPEAVLKSVFKDQLK